MLTQTLKNSGHGSTEGNPVGGFCIATVKYPSPGFYVMEEWKDIEGFEGLYRISNEGRVFSIRRRIILSPKERKYKSVGLHHKGKCKIFLVHRLVAMAFIPNPNNYPEVNHINFDGLDNMVYNLEWCTRLQNQGHAQANGRYKNINTGSKHGQSKLTEPQVRQIRTKILTGKEYAEMFGVSQSTISGIQNSNLNHWSHVK